ncbi:hypothetical protein HG536_0H01430 [Torulaspora globosa]|uniref:Elongation factor 1-gamma 1 n=1 Tax=Torulaspora globosa TaxID=48254 RepID=A0A7G3ZMN2_9SACH|nr:uncharacterized protein HG536_0H01430 [Torulaspora globosa]QLL34768.1 hypothetical protein HG536_0H01430 [Torulaspora globosa]
MSQKSVLYSNFRIRSWVPRALVRYLGLDVQVVNPYCEEAEKEFAQHFPLKKLPAFLGPNGFKLTEQIAINHYLINSSKDEKIKAQLLGAPADIKTQAEILRWESLANSDLIVFMVRVFKPLIEEGVPYVKKDADAAWAVVEEIAGIYEARLSEKTYLVGERITLADLVSAAAFTRGFNYLFGAAWRKQHPSIVRWFNTVTAGEILRDEYRDFKFIDEPVKPPQNVSKKKEKKKEAAPAASKPKPEVEEKPAEARKPKHPLELLGKSSFVLDEWKRKYSNEDTRPVALPWFWEHYNPEEYSLWRVDYKYNDELTLTFMSNNLIGGFFNRLSASTKYMFGCLVVYGENNNNGITGAVMLRGQDHVPAFDVAPDWESYSYTKLDPSNEQDKEFVNDMWAWDRPVVANGEPREIADGKVLK